MNCVGCNKEIEIGDRYIEDTVSGFLRSETEPDTYGIIAELFGGAGGKVFFCEDCTEDGGDYLYETNYGDAEDE